MKIKGLIGFARFNWREKNKPGSVGVLIILLFAIVLPVYMFFFRQSWRYEKVY